MLELLYDRGNFFAIEDDVKGILFLISSLKLSIAYDYPAYFFVGPSRLGVFNLKTEPVQIQG